MHDAASPRPATLALTLELPDESATLALGAALAAALPDDLTVYLHGDLGAGKTTLVRGLLRALGFSGRVRSPSFTLLELYAISSFQIYHFDFYRFASPDEFLDAGFDDDFRAPGVRLIEWPEHAAPHLPPADLDIRLLMAGAGRQARLTAQGTRGITCLGSLNFLAHWPAANGCAPPSSAD